jgi:hypothetical protein
MGILKIPHTSTDGRVRAADIEYKLPGESVFRTITRPIHKMVLVIPVEEQTPTTGRAEEDDVGSDQVASLTEEVPAPARAETAGTAEMTPPEVRPEAARGIEAKAEEGRGLSEAEHCPPQGREGAARPAIKFRKVISRKKAGKQARTIIVTTPKEEAEMIDVGARPKKRGRPKKVPNVDPPDPHKGSVLYPGKGECADPVNEGAILGRGDRAPIVRAGSVS